MPSKTQNTGYSRGVMATREEERRRPQRTAEYMSSMRLPSNIRQLVQTAMVQDPNIEGLATRANALMADYQMDPQLRRQGSLESFIRQGLGGFAEQLNAQQQRRDAEHQRTLAVMERRRQEAAKQETPFTTGEVNGQQVYIPQYGQAERFGSYVAGLRNEAAALGVNAPRGVRGDQAVNAQDLDALRSDVTTGKLLKSQLERQQALDEELRKIEAEGKAKAEAERAKRGTTEQNNAVKEQQKREKAMKDFAGTTFKEYENQFRSAVGGSRLLVRRKRGGDAFGNGGENISEYVPNSVDNQELALKQARIPYVREGGLFGMGGRIRPMTPEELQQDRYFEERRRAKFGDTGNAVQRGLEGGPLGFLGSMLTGTLDSGDTGTQAMPPQSASNAPQSPSAPSMGAVGAPKSGGAQKAPKTPRETMLAYVSALDTLDPNDRDDQAKVKQALTALSKRDSAGSAQLRAAARAKGFRV